MSVRVSVTCISCLWLPFWPRLFCLFFVCLNKPIRVIHQSNLPKNHRKKEERLLGISSLKSQTSFSYN